MCGASIKNCRYFLSFLVSINYSSWSTIYPHLKPICKSNIYNIWCYVRNLLYMNYIYKYIYIYYTSCRSIQVIISLSLSLSLYIHQSIHLSAQLSVYLAKSKVNLSIGMYLSICMDVYLYLSNDTIFRIDIELYPLIYLPIYLPTYLTIYLSIYLSTYLSIYL